jgi:MOSC domain-containing protein YiiM
METVSPKPVHLSTEAIEAGLEGIRQAPADVGVVELIVRRPAVDEREVLEEGVLDARVGLVGDTWIGRRSGRTEDGSPHPDMQLNIMNARVIRLLADSADRERWALAGDQLYLDLDISEANLPAGTRLALGSAVIEVTDQPHTGCQKFSSRFGVDALRFVNSPVGRELHLRGINARVVEGGTVRAGDTVRKLPA